MVENVLDVCLERKIGFFVIFRCLGIRYSGGNKMFLVFSNIGRKRRDRLLYLIFGFLRIGEEK